jgi:hypothetical protein
METMYVNMRQTRLREMMALLDHRLVIVPTGGADGELLTRRRQSRH